MSTEPAALIAELNLDLSDEQTARLAALLGFLALEQHAPTSVREPAQARDVHLADSLVALELEPIHAAGRIADVGSGAGFPGMALAAALPQATVSLVESQRRSCEFLARAREAAGLENAWIVCERAEEWFEGLHANDMVLARAIAPQPVVLEYAAPLLRVGGTLVDWRGKRAAQEEAAARVAAELLGLQLREIRHVVPFTGARDRHLHVFAKVAETPARFPRRAGVARKRPLAV
jgi:16S rRNA (guanine527-N7)-methyltransferase